MTKADLQKLIRQEVTSVVRSELQKIVKPLVQESVAGALAGLLAEGIVKGPSTPKSRQILAPNIPQTRSQAAPGGRQAAPGRNIDPSVRRRMAEQLGYGQIDRVGTPADGFLGDGSVSDILTETAMEMADGAGFVDSILDASDSLQGAVAPEVVDAITRDYSGLMAAINRRGKLNG